MITKRILRLFHHAFVAGMIFAAIGTAPADAQNVDRTQLIERAQRSVVVIHTFDSRGKAIGAGSGVVIPSGRILTNAHVLEGAARVEVYDQQDRLLGTTQFAEQISTRADVAVLPPLPNARVSSSFADDEPAVGEDVIVIGSPLGLTNTVSTGIVSGYRRVRGSRWMQITAPISEGSSGGPVLNARGEIVGLSVALLGEGQNLNFAVPLYELRAVEGSPRGRIAFPFGAPADGAATAQSEKAATSRRGVVPSSATPIVPGIPQRGALGSGSNGGTLDDGSAYNLYSFHGTRNQRVFFVGLSDEASVHLRLVSFGRNGDLEILGGTPERGASISPSFQIQLPAAGEFFLVISGAASDRPTPYQVAMATEAMHPAATQGRWTLADINVELIYFVDRSSIKRMGPRRHEAWIRMLNFKPQSSPAGELDETIVHMDFDCGASRSRAKYIIQYGSGRVIYQGAAVAPWDQWQPIVPGSLVQSGAAIVCN